MKKVEWASGFDKPTSTLVPIKQQTAPLTQQKTLTKKEAEEAFREIDRAWIAGNPYSIHAHAKRSGRFVIDMVCERFNVSQDVAADHVQSWQRNEYMMIDLPARKGAATGLRVMKMLEADQ